MKQFYQDILLVIILAIFAYGLLFFMPGQGLSPYSYKYAMEVKDAMGPVFSPVFYMASAAIYSAVYGPFSKAGFEAFAFFVPPAIGILAALLVYAASRSMFGPWPSLAAAVVFLASPPIMLNAMPGVYTPQLVGILLFPISIALFFFSLRISQQPLNAIPAVLAGIACGFGASSMGAGIVFALALSAVVVAWPVLLLLSKKDYARESISAVAFALPSLLLAFYMGAGIPSAAPDFGALLSNFAIAAPLAIVSFAVCANSILRGKPSGEEYLMALLVVAGIATGAFDPPSSLVLFAIPFAHGAGLLSRQPSRTAYVAAAFAVFLSAFAFYGVSTGSLNASFAFLVAFAAAGVAFMYDKEDARKYASFGAIAISIFLVSFHAVTSPYSAQSLGGHWQGAFSWLEQNADGGSVASMTPEGMIAFETGRQECNCSAEFAKYLLSSSSASSLKERGAGYLVFEKNLLFNMAYLRQLAGDEETRIEVYRYYGESTEDSGAISAVYVSESGSALFIQVDESGKPVGETVYVNDLGAIPFGRLKYFGNSTNTNDPSLFFVLPIRGAETNLFKMLSGPPPNTTKVFENEGIWIFRLD